MKLIRKKFNIKTDAKITLVRTGELITLEVKGKGDLLIEALASILDQHEEFAGLMEEAAKLRAARMRGMVMNKQRIIPTGLPGFTTKRKVVN